MSSVWLLMIEISVLQMEQPVYFYVTTPTTECLSQFIFTLNFEKIKNNNRFFLLNLGCHETLQTKFSFFLVYNQPQSE